jgi:hypothetical protein
LGPTAGEYDYVEGGKIDVVHTLKNCISKIIKMMKGKRAVKLRRNASPAAQAQHARYNTQLCIIVQYNIQYHSAETRQRARYSFGLKPNRHGPTASMPPFRSRQTVFGVQ